MYTVAALRDRGADVTSVVVVMVMVMVMVVVGQLHRWRSSLW
jgi:hypothetical protein